MYGTQTLEYACPAKRQQNEHGKKFQKKFQRNRQLIYTVSIPASILLLIPARENENTSFVP